MAEGPKVVSLRTGAEILPPGEPRPKVIAVLEGYLERARSGDICAVALAYTYSDGATGFHCEGKLNDSILGAVTRMQRGLADSA